MKKNLGYIMILALVVALPLIFRRPAEKLAPAAKQLVVISPHNEAQRFEIEVAFREYYRERHGGEEVSIDWRNVGGTSEVVKYIRSTFNANFQHEWTTNHPEEKWSDALAEAVFSSKTDLNAGTLEARARGEFLAGETSIDIDILYGGGQYDHGSLAGAGILVPIGLRQRRPEWFSGAEPIIAQGGGGEIWYDPEDRYYATCFSTFGIVYNLDRLKQAGFSDEEIAHFGERWSDLADPRLYRAIGIADPTQSGSITKCYEMLIQREMQNFLAGNQQPTQDELDDAWRAALTLLKRLGGNAAYLTFGASKVPVDAATGQIAAGMCIDFYGRSQVEWETEHVGRETIAYRTPTGASTVSADPIAILRGAPNRELAEEFVEFTLTPEAQRLCGRRAGTPGGPRKYSLYRLPVRRDMYTPEERSSAPLLGDADPFALASSFQYKAAWTARLFNLMRVIVKVMLIDCGPELRARCGEIIASGGWDHLSPEAQSAFSALPFEHHEAAAASQALSAPETQAETVREWITFFREHY